eukprot:COSAG05_NODE_50_length_24118_cov_89.534036_20_plen_233_part_00
MCHLCALVASDRSLATTTVGVDRSRSIGSYNLPIADWQEAPAACRIRMDTTPPALSERNMSPTASPITSPAMLDPCVGGQASMLLRRIRSPERKAFMAAPPSRRRRPRGESTPPTTEECTAPNERCINCHIPGKPAAEARGAHQVPLKEEREEEYEYEYEPDDDDEFVAPPPPDRRPLSRDRSPPRHSERQSVRRFRSPPCSGDVEASPDRSVCLNVRCSIHNPLRAPDHSH